jgi:hypothetical protein
MPGGKFSKCFKVVFSIQNHGNILISFHQCRKSGVEILGNMSYSGHRIGKLQGLSQNKTEGFSAKASFCYCSATLLLNSALGNLINLMKLKCLFM